MDINAKVQVDKLTANFKIEWIDDQGVNHNREGTIAFPNDLAIIPPWIEEGIFTLILNSTLDKLGVNADLEGL